jgi:hypothetical protein
MEIWGARECGAYKGYLTLDEGARQRRRAAKDLFS